MSMLIQHNLMAINAFRQLETVSKSRTKSSEKLSSGYRINRSADDAAGLAISEKMRRQIRGLDQGTKNMQDGISLCQVADGGLVETQAILQRINELCIKAANGTNSFSDRAMIQQEINELNCEIDRIAYTTTFNDHIHPLHDRSSGKNAAGQLGSYVITHEVTHTYFGTKYGSNEVQYGDFYVTTRGKEGVDFEYDAVNREFKILSGKDIQITTKGLTTNYDHIVVANGVSANVCLRDCVINTSGPQGIAAFKIEDNSTGDVTVTIRGNNVLTSGLGAAGLQKNGGTSTGTLLLQGSGELRATGNVSSSGSATAAGIGGGFGQSASNIKITSATIIASSNGSTAAGIGGSGNRGLNRVAHGDGNNIEITGGNVEAHGGDDAAGIGGSFNGGGNNISISGGYVYARADYGMRSISRYGWSVGSGYPNSGGITRRTSSVSVDGTPVTDPYGILGDIVEAGDASYYHWTYGTRQIYTEEPEPLDYYTEIEYIDEVVNALIGGRYRDDQGRLRIQMGPDVTDGLYMHLVDASANELGIQGLNVLSAESARGSIDKVAAAINTVSGYRSYFGAMQNRFESSMKVNDNASENL